MPEVARAKRPSSASLADIATTPTVTQPRPSCGGGTHRICAWRVCISGPLKCELEEGLRLPKIPVLQGGEGVNLMTYALWPDRSGGLGPWLTAVGLAFGVCVPLGILDVRLYRRLKRLCDAAGVGRGRL